MQRLSLVVAVTVAGLGMGLSGAMAQPANDLCGNAQSLSSGAAVNGTTAGAAVDQAAPCVTDTRDVWYTFTPTVLGPYRFTVTGTNNADLSLALITNCGFPYGIDDCAVGTGSDGPRVVMNFVFEGQPTLLRVGSNQDQAFTILAEPLPPPVNDECAGAVSLTLGVPVSASNLGATTSFGLTDAAMCQSTSAGFAGAADVFYSFVAPYTGYFDISTCGAEYDTILSVHAACPASAANAIACNDNGPRTGCGAFSSYPSYLTGVALTGGVNYFIRVAAVVPEGSPFVPQARFEVKVAAGELTPPPRNDTCATAEALSPDNRAIGSTVYANGGTPSSCGSNDLWDVWYSFTATQPVKTIYTVAIPGNSFDNQATLSAFDACGGAEIACQAFNPLTNPDMRLLLALDPNQTVYIRVAGAEGSQDEFAIQTQTGPAAAPNGTCATAAALGVNTPVSVDTTTATSSTPSPCGDLTDAYGLWYSFQAPSAGWYRFATEAPEGAPSTIMSIYSSCGASSPLICRAQGDALSAEIRNAAASLQMAAGQRVYMRVAETSSGRGVFTLTATGPLASPPAVGNRVRGGDGGGLDAV